MTDDTRELPPRGKAFAVTRFSHVAGGPTPPTMVLGKRRFETRTQALSSLWDLDPRLDPHVTVVDKVERESFDDLA